MNFEEYRNLLGVLGVPPSQKTGESDILGESSSRRIPWLKCSSLKISTEPTTLDLKLCLDVSVSREMESESIHKLVIDPQFFNMNMGVQTTGSSF